MQHRNRALVALGATLGMILATFALAPAATAGHQNDTTFDTTTLSGTGPQSGTLANGVEWTVDKGTGPNVQGYTIRPADGPQTYTFSEPVSLTFDIAGLNCAGEAIQLQPGIEPVTINAHHSWNAATRTVTGSGAAVDDASTFKSSGPVTSFAIQAVNQASCVRGVSLFQVGYLDNDTPTASIAAPIEGGQYPQGANILADYSCADADTVHVDHVDCVGDVADGAPIDTSTVGSHAFTVTATDEHGASSQTSVNYTVTEQLGLCSGTAVGLPLNINLGAANAGQTPCVTDSSKLLNLNLSLGSLPFPLSALSPSLQVKVAEGTSEKDGNIHKGSATVDYVKIAFPLNAWSLELKDLWSEVSASTPGACGAGNDLQGTAEIGRVVRNGTFLYNQLNKPLSLPIPLVGGVYLNRVVKTGKQVSADAVAIDLPGGLLDINIGSSTAGVDC